MSLSEKIAIAIVGIGDAFENQYWEQLRALDSTEWKVYCLDNSSYWHSGIRARREATCEKIDGAGFEFIDTSDAAEYEKFINQHKLALVILAVPDKAHMLELRKWVNADVGEIIVEKPLSDDPEKVRDFLKDLGEAIPEQKLKKIRYFDHYRGKLHAHFKDRAFWTHLRKNWELGRITGFRFFCLEDFSGTDDAYLSRESGRGNKISPELNGSIEVSGREGALDRGMIFDLGSHMLAVIEYLGNVSTLELDEIRAGRYVGVADENGSLKNEVLREDGSFVRRLMQTTRIANETFAQFKFKFKDYQERSIRGEAYLGKGIRGIRAPREFYIPVDNPLLGEVKLIELQGEGGKRAHFFLKRDEVYKAETKLLSDERGTVLDRGEFPISDSHKVAFEEFLSPPKEKTGLFLSLSKASEILEKLEEIQGRIRGKVFPYYSLGRREGGREQEFADRPIISRAEYLDSIVHRFEPLWKRE